MIELAMTRCYDTNTPLEQIGFAVHRNSISSICILISRIYFLSTANVYMFEVNALG